MRRFRAALTIMAATAIVSALAVPTAQAHQWGNWHWNRFGSNVTIQVRNFGTYANEAQQAINDWNNNTILSLPRVNFHTDISVYDGNYGNTGWGGLASIQNASGSHITHGHAQLNYYYGYSSAMKRGIQCQEVGHLFGLDHSNDGCMGLGYYNNSITTVQHNWNDIYNMYRFSHHGPAPQAAEEKAGPPQMFAVWHNQPRSVAKALRMGDNVVRATVTGVRQANDIVVPAAGEPGGVDRVPTQEITFRTGQVFKGKVGRTFTVFRTGTDAVGIEGDPVYRAGQEYILILKGQRPDGRRVLLSPEGRYLLDGGVVRTESAAPGVAKLDGMGYGAFRGLVNRNT